MGKTNQQSQTPTSKAEERNRSLMPVSHAKDD
jgi:hypothetical protein